MFGRFCRLSPIINISIKGFAVKVILTVGRVSPLSLLISCALINSRQLHAKASFFFSKSRNYSCLLYSLSLILASLIYYSVFNLAIWGLFPHLATSKPLLNRHLIHYSESSTQQTTFWNWPLEGLLILPPFPRHYPPYLSVIVEQLFGSYSHLGCRAFSLSEKHPCLCSLHKTPSIKLWRGSIQSRQSQVPIVAILLKSFCVYDKSLPIAVGFCSGVLSRLWSSFGKDRPLWSSGSYNHMQLW